MRTLFQASFSPFVFRIQCTKCVFLQTVSWFLITSFKRGVMAQFWEVGCLRHLSSFRNAELFHVPSGAETAWLGKKLGSCWNSANDAPGLHRRGCISVHGEKTNGRMSSFLVMLDTHGLLHGNAKQASRCNLRMRILSRNPTVKLSGRMCYREHVWWLCDM